jgi:hypothetical protein
VVVWTLASFVAAIVLAMFAMASLYEAQQACFFAFPSVPCPDGQDWRVGLLTFALLGVPFIWLVGLVVATAGRAVAKKQGERRA